MNVNLDKLEVQACIAKPLNKAGFNASATLPYGLKIGHVKKAMQQFLDFLSFMNQQLNGQGMERLESMLMSANFSSLVGEFMKSNLPRNCRTIAANQYHNGHPDLVPIGKFPRNSVQYTNEGIELKASRYPSGWQGHNPEDIWLMVFVFDSNRASDKAANVLPRPFSFIKVVGAEISKTDWRPSGRGEGSRRTVTASVTRSGFDKMELNWIYRNNKSQ